MSESFDLGTTDKYGFLLFQTERGRWRHLDHLEEKYHDSLMSFERKHYPTRKDVNGFTYYIVEDPNDKNTLFMFFPNGNERRQLGGNWWAEPIPVGTPYGPIFRSLTASAPAPPSRPIFQAKRIRHSSVPQEAPAPPSRARSRSRSRPRNRNRSRSRSRSGSRSRRKRTRKEEKKEEDEEDEKEIGALFDCAGSSKTQCVICMDKMEAHQVFYTLQCGHCFHKDCLTRWLNTKKICPICKKPAEVIQEFTRFEKGYPMAVSDLFR